MRCAHPGTANQSLPEITMRQSFYRAAMLGAALLLPFAASAATSAPVGTGVTTMNMVSQLPGFLKKLDTLRGKALSATEKAGVTDVVTLGSSTLNDIQAKFVSGVAKATGVDGGTLGGILPPATRAVAGTDLVNSIQDKLGKRLGFLQSNGVKAANALRNNSLDGLKSSLAAGISRKTGVDPQMITGLLPLLGF
jgi:hypothetical protein